MAPDFPFGLWKKHFPGGDQLMKLSEINIRDPFVLVDHGTYYLYGTRGPTCWGEADGFDVYVSRDMENWEGPLVCFQNDGTFWADRNYWAPEVHVWRGKYYMFASFKAESVCRGTAILKSDSPEGPFKPHSEGCITPPEWECLDGTFYVSKAGKPYMVFCHEWVQAGDGEVCSVELNDDLSAPVGEVRILFHASDAPWCQVKHHSSGVSGCVTDGPFLWRTAEDKLECLWASFSETGYTEGVAVSDNGDIDGHFYQAEPLFMNDGGHGMVFRANSGQLYLTLHTPNTHLEEHPVFYPLEEKDGLLVNAPLPGWHPALVEELTQMASRLTSLLQPWHGTTFQVTPEECGYQGGLATQAIQRAIDLASEKNGTVYLANGDYVSGTLELKSGVRLMISENARLLASADLENYPEHHARRLTVQDTSMGMHQSLIYAEGCRNIALCGKGEINGQGTPDHFPGQETAQGTPGRPFVIRIIDCEDVYISGLTMRNSPCWMQSYLNCDRVLIENLTVLNHANYNNDGIDLDGCRDVIVRHCVIHSGDDACCFKGASQRPLERVLVENCELFSACNALKVGTDTQGDFRKILVRHCTIGGLQYDPSGLKHPYSDSGISLEMLDGGTLEDVVISDITMLRAWSPVFMRLENRGRVKPGDPVPSIGKMHRIVIEHLKGEDCGPRGSYMIAVPEQPIRDISVRDVQIMQNVSTKPVIREQDIGELRGIYPDAHMIDDLGDAPAYALWARHVHDLSLSNYTVIPQGDDPRPEYVLSTDVTCI